VQQISEPSKCPCALHMVWEKDEHSVSPNYLTLRLHLDSSGHNKGIWRKKQKMTKGKSNASWSWLPLWATGTQYCIRTSGKPDKCASKVPQNGKVIRAPISHGLGPRGSGPPRVHLHKGELQPVPWRSSEAARQRMLRHLTQTSGSTSTFRTFLTATPT
jgi:hypothetical protein